MKPVRLPTLHIDLDGAPLEISVQVTSLRVLRALSSPAMAEISLTGNTRPPRLGASLRIDGLGAVFSGRVIAVEHSHRQGTGETWTVRAFDALHDMKTQGAAAALSDVTLGDIVRELAAKYGLEDSVNDTLPIIPHIVRTARNDFAFLTVETQRAGRWFYLDGTTLHVIGAEGSGDARQVRLATDTLDARLEVNGVDATGAISVSAIDPGTLDPHAGLAFGLDEAGAFGSASLGASEGLPIYDLSASTADEALGVATAEMERRDGARVVLRAIFDGDRAPALADPLIITDDALAPQVPLVVSRVEHRIDAVAGHIAEVSTAPPFIATPPALPRSFWGVVTNTNDPTGTGRTRCRLPQYDDVETSWLQVVRPLAGPGRGWVTVPTRGDSVLIHAPSGRPEHGVVLGAVTGREALALDAGDGCRTGLVTGAGHRLTFDDNTGEAALEVPDGSRCTFGPDGVSVTASGDLTLEAPGNRVTIRGDQIEFERG